MGKRRLSGEQMRQAAGTRRRGRLELVRYALAGAVGLAVFVLLSNGTNAQGACPTAIAEPYPDCRRQTMTAQAGGSAATATFTPVASATPTSTLPGASATPTNTPAGLQASQAATPTPVPANSAVIMGGRGHVANVRANAFTVLWMTDTDMTAQVSFGTTTALGSVATDQRAAFTGQTHYVEAGGLQPATVYYFDVQSGGTVDNNGGQHYQIKTGPDIGAPPQGNFIQGPVLNPGGGSPAGGALVWGDIKDANSQGSGGTSQLLSALAGADGRYRLDLNARVPDLSAYFTYSNSNDQVELNAQASGGIALLTVDTSFSQNGGTAPQDVRLVLQPVTPTPTATPAPGAIAVTPSPTSTPAPPAPVAPSPTPVSPAATPTPPPPPPAPFATPTATAGAPLQMPVQLPPLRDMLLTQMGLQPATPTPIALAQAIPGYPAQPAPAPPPVATVVATPPPGGALLQPPSVVVTVVPGPPGVSPGGAPGTRVLPPAPTSAAPPLGTPFGGQRPLGPSPPTVPAPPPSPTPTITAGVLSGLAAMPALVSVLFYGGVLLALAGAGVAIYSLLKGPDWRPR